MSINFTTFSGNVAKDPSVKVSADGSWVFVTGSIGVGYTEKNKAGQYEKKTIWKNFKIIAKASQQARLDRIQKGAILLITGPEKCDKYMKDGAEKSFEFVQVEEWEIIERFNAGEPKVAAVNTTADDEDIPF